MLQTLDTSVFAPKTLASAAVCPVSFDITPTMSQQSEQTSLEMSSFWNQKRGIK